MEVWKKIDQNMYPKGKFGQTYSVSNYGRVRNDKTGRILKPRKGRKGYLRVNLVGKDFMIHRLVALTFIKNKNKNFDQVNHIDGNKENNHVSNLEWCDNSINQKHAYKLGFRNSSGENNGNAKITDEQILEIWEKQLDPYDIHKKYGVSMNMLKEYIIKRLEHIYLVKI